MYMDLPEKSITKKKRIAVIGAGPSGLISLFALQEEDCFEPVCFEATDRYGGMWNYREEVSPEGYGSLMFTTTAIHSKEMGAISNFPPKKEYSNYMRHQQIFEYMTDFCKRFGVEKYIRFNSEVIAVRKAEDYAKTGRFLVTVKDKKNGKLSTDIFDGVMIATGHFNYPKMGKFPGMEAFRGKVIHTHSLKRVDEFYGENVLVIGTGCSGLDAADTISSVAKQVYLSARNGMFVLSRVGPNGYPMDHLTIRRYITCLLDYLPANICSWYIETFYLDSKFDHTLYYVKPKYHLLSKDPSFNDAIAFKLLSGAVIQKRAVKCFTENGVVFEGEETVTEIDAVIMGTGYTFKFPFLEDGLLEIENGQINLYKCMFPVQLSHPSLVFIGFLNPFGPGTPLCETQCRWAARVLAGKSKLPSMEIMLKRVTDIHRKNELRYAPSEYMSVRIDYVSYLDDIASEIGCKPNLLKYLLTDFRLFLRLVFGPCLPYQYRLEGPHKWEGAREAIMTSEERLHWTLSRENRSKKGVLQLLWEYIGTIIPKNILFT